MHQAKNIGADISRKQACPHAALYQEKIPEHLVFRKAESKRPFNPLLSLFELNLSKSLERKQEKSNPKLLANNQLMTSAQRPVIRQRNFLEESLLRAKSAKVTKFSTRQAKSKFTPGSLTLRDPKENTLCPLKQPSRKHYLKAIADVSVVCKDTQADVNKGKSICCFSVQLQCSEH